MIQNTEFGRIELTTIPTPADWADVDGTYTPSGRVLVNYRTAKNDFNVVTMNDDGTGIVPVFEGEIPQKRTANGIRWMCFSDNKRVLLGDYVLEVTPNLDHAEEACLLPVTFPEVLMTYPQMFRHWSEIIIAPDCRHMAWTMLTFTGASCFIGSLVRYEDHYVIEDARCISSKGAYVADPDHEGYVIPQVLRGGEYKQFVHGGSAITMVGNSPSLSDSVIEELGTGRTQRFSNTAGYEETAMFSPDETLAVCMSPRFSPGTDCGIIGQVPLPHSEMVRSGISNAAYMYAVASCRSYRSGNVGPALVDVKRTLTEGRAYQGVDLHDPDNRFVYYSPLSWAPCSTKAMWPEGTRMTDPVSERRLRIVKLLDRAPSAPVAAVATPEPWEIPYAMTLEEFLQPVEPIAPPYRIRGAVSGEILCEITEDGWKKETYIDFSDDGESIYNGTIASKSPRNMFAGGTTTFTGDVTVVGAHTGALQATIIFEQPGPDQPARLSEASQGFATYDGVTRKVEEMLP